MPGHILRAQGTCRISSQAAEAYRAVTGDLPASTSQEYLHPAEANMRCTRCDEPPAANAKTKRNPRGKPDLVCEREQSSSGYLLSGRRCCGGFDDKWPVFGEHRDVWGAHLLTLRQRRAEDRSNPLESE